jgi:hypothetical protein
LKITERGQHNAQLTQRLEAYLERSGPVSHSQSLSAAERDTRDIAKWRDIASKRRAPLILWGEIEKLDESRRNVVLHLFNVRTGDPQDGLESCAAAAVEEKLKGLADQVLATQEPAAPQLAQPVAQHATEAPLAVSSTTRPAAHRQRPAWRTGLGISLASLGAGLLVSAVTLTALQGQHKGPGCLYTMYPHPDRPAWDGCQYDNLVLYPFGYAAAAALGVGAWLTLDWPYR